MLNSDEKEKRITAAWWIAIAIVAIAGIYIHAVNLDADPPMYFTGHGQSLSTDPYHYSYFARNKVLFDRWEMYGSDRWRMFELTLVSGLSYLFFVTVGVSRTVANSPGLVLSLLSIFVFLLALRKWLNLKGIFLVLVFLIFNKALYVFGRLPYTENGMNLFLCLAFYVFMYRRHKLDGQILLGVLIALAGLAGKIFGFILIIPVVLTFRIETGKWRAAVPAVITMIGLSVVWILAAYGGDLGRFFGFYGSQTVGLYGFPEALTSPITLIERFISFGNDSRYYFHAPVLGGALFLSGLILLSRKNRKVIAGNTPLVFLIIWFLIGWLAFMPENYRPLRYIYMLYFPMAGIAGYILSADVDSAKKSKFGPDWLRALIVFILAWVVIEQTWLNLYTYIQFEEQHRRLVWLSAPIALLIALIDWKFMLSGMLGRRKVRRVLFYAAAVLVAVNFAFPYVKWQKQISFNIKEAGDDLGQILNEGAVICGPIAPTLLLENKLGGAIYAIGMTDSDPDFFRKVPVTHFVIDAESSGRIINKYPELEAADEIAKYWIRDSEILVVRISKRTGNPDAERYRPTDYEIGRDFMKAGIYDSAVVYLERFATNHPDCKSSLKNLLDLYPMFDMIDQAISAANWVVTLYPDDFSVLMSLGIFYQKLYVATGDTSFRDISRKAYEKVISKNPYQADEVTEMIKKIDSYRRPAQPGR